MKKVSLKYKPGIIPVLLVVGILAVLVFVAIVLFGPDSIKNLGSFSQRKQTQETEAAGKGSRGGNSATIDFADAQASTTITAGSTVTFIVTANVREKDLHSLWVANRCSQNGVPMYQEYHGVAVDSTWLSGPFTLDFPNGGAADCKAYVWLFPDPETVVRGGSMTYSVGP